MGAMTIPLTAKQWHALDVLSRETEWIYPPDLHIHDNIFARLTRMGYVEQRSYSGYTRTGRATWGAWQYRITDAGRQRLELQP